MQHDGVHPAETGSGGLPESYLYLQGEDNMLGG